MTKSIEHKPAPKPRSKMPYHGHQQLDGVSVHAFDAPVSERFIRYHITFANGNKHQVDKLGSCAFHAYHMEDLLTYINREKRFN